MTHEIESKKKPFDSLMPTWLWQSENQPKISWAVSTIESAPRSSVDTEATFWAECFTKKKTLKIRNKKILCKRPASVAFEVRSPQYCALVLCTRFFSQSIDFLELGSPNKLGLPKHDYIIHISVICTSRPAFLFRRGPPNSARQIPQLSIVATPPALLLVPLAGSGLHP